MRIGAVVIILAICLTLQAAEGPSGGFGEGVQGVSIALLPAADGQNHPVVVLRNENPSALVLKGAFAWLLLVESRDVAFYSRKIPLDTAQEAIAPAGELRCSIKVDQLWVDEYQKGMKVISGYPQLLESGNARSGARLLAKLLETPHKAQAIVFVPAGGQRITVRSKAATLGLARAASTQPDDLTALLERFRHDAFAARDAADLAAAKGARAIPVLVQGLHDPSMPDSGQLWIATALTRISGDEAANAVVPLVADPREGVRDVIAFYGPTMKDQRVDNAILGRAESGKDPLFTAWAARGFADHGRPVPAGLVTAALASSEPRARAEVAEVLAVSADPADARRLAKLFSDENELVRVAAADAVGRHPKQPRATFGAMVAALDFPGESARARIVGALARSSGRDWRYLPDGPAEQNKAVVEEIRMWWEKQK